MYRAAWIIADDFTIVPDGIVTVANEKIVDVGKYHSNCSQSKIIDLGKGLLVPGLVNAHTHLEFSELEKPLGQPGIEFTQWIRLIIVARMKANQSHENKADRIKRGMLESFDTGVWTIGEIASVPIEASDYRFSCDDSRSQLQSVVFHEQLGRQSVLFDEKIRTVEEFLREKNDREQNLVRAISPHAPYSVHPEMLRRLCKTAVDYHVPVAMHLAETMAERELLDHQTGNFVDLLQDLGVWEPSTFVPPTTIMEHLKILSTAPQSLVIHGNYLTESEIDFVASQRDRMSVVFCPRTHHYFRHTKYPLPKLLRSGINVAVGTDSRASNPDLNLFAELKLIARNFSDVDRMDVLKMGTQNGAAALGLSGQTGSIASGYRAALSLIKPAAENLAAQNPVEWMFDDGSVCEPVQGKS